MGISIDRISTIIKRSFETRNIQTCRGIFETTKTNNPRTKEVRHNVESDILRVYRAKFQCNHNMLFIIKFIRVRTLRNF